MAILAVASATIPKRKGTAVGGVDWPDDRQELCNKHEEEENKLHLDASLDQSPSSNVGRMRP